MLCTTCRTTFKDVKVSRGVHRGGGEQRGHFAPTLRLKGALKSTIEIESEYLYVWGATGKFPPGLQNCLGGSES